MPPEARAWSIALIVTVTLGLGCHRGTDPTNREAAAPAVVATSAPAEPHPPPMSADAGRLAGPYAGLPPLDDGTGIVHLEGRSVGFSSDDRYLGFEISVCDPCPSQFRFVGPGVPSMTFSYFWEPGLPEDVAERRKKINDEAVERKLLALGVAKADETRVLRGPFPYPELTFATKTARDDTTGKVTLLFGARVDDEEPVFPMRVVLGPHPMFEPTKDMRARLAQLPKAERSDELQNWHSQFQMYNPLLAYANVTKNGKELGVVVMAGGNQWHETAGVARMPVDRFVAQVRAETKARRSRP